ncbi:CIA30 family protein [Yoonia sediminilitoris]|uniref:Complex I intermediate-associated protein 30 (CIA30) n=1 Tax=Yoonia sediminilitoris TaxID=1286148 RepID=A0A2T6KFL4_9RHOB|nr:CIA30 family protein [Yoonia sediminilitoris]PUB14129.1 complex I intermediate-associated protein 30 (CIA30) [Yoonia sediminilitoris]RCW95060.1 complex I intermediate-associated protein 30 (CIA30) [Yoonia sediminilitoris]
MGKREQVALVPEWEYVADSVMGGVSQGELTSGRVQGRTATRLHGQVSLENNGGFLQMAFDLRPDGGAVDVSAWSGIEMDVFGNDETYDLRLRTTQLARPWQSFRATFEAPNVWTALRVPFATFKPHRIDADFDPTGLRRMGVLAVGRIFTADVAVAGVRLYR